MLQEVTCCPQWGRKPHGPKDTTQILSVPVSCTLNLQELDQKLAAAVSALTSIPGLSIQGLTKEQLLGRLEPFQGV